MESPHRPVLTDEVIHGLDPRPGGIVIDCTAGFGGHARLLAARIGRDGTLLCLDRDTTAIDWLTRTLENCGPRVLIRRGTFGALGQHADAVGLTPGSVDAILLDLGVSSAQLDRGERGFSIQNDGPLDARMDQTGAVTAADLVRDLDEHALAQLFREHGDEPHARRIAHAIVTARGKTPIDRTHQLAELVERAVGGRRGRRIHPATRVFQALRIAVNAESSELQLVLPSALELLAPQGRLAVISYHSHEDRVVKQFFRHHSADCICPPRQPACTCDHRATLSLRPRRAIKPSEDEIRENARARSARLRIAVRLGVSGDLR